MSTEIIKSEAEMARDRAHIYEARCYEEEAKSKILTEKWHRAIAFLGVVLLFVAAFMLIAVGFKGVLYLYS